MHVVWVGRGWGFIPCSSLTLSQFSSTLPLCVRLGMRAWCAPLAPSFVFLTYLFVFSLFPHCPWPPHTFCALVVFFFVVYLAVVGAWLGFLFYACVAVHVICRMHGAVTYLVVIPLFSRGPWSCFLCLWFGVSPFVVVPSLFFSSTRTSLLAPTTHTLLGGLEHALFIFFVVAVRLFLVFASILLLCCPSVHKSLARRTQTWLGVLGHATLNFVAVATLLFFSFCVCPKFCDLAKQRRKIFVGVSEVGKNDFALYIFWLCVFFLVFLFLLLRLRDAIPKLRPLQRVTPYISLQTEMYNMGASIAKHIPSI